MSLITSPLAMTLRSALRPLGVNRLLVRLLDGGRYEAKLSETMVSSISKGDIVWDIGANIGLYTKRFAEIVSPEGHVYAFEPSTKNLEVLRTAVAGIEQVTIFPLALSDSAGTVVFLQGVDEAGSLSRVAGKGDNQGLQTEIVERTLGDHLVAMQAAKVPTVIKIDVEGHELQVLEGMKSVLSSDDVKHVFIEVHFRLLQEQGHADGPAEIERLMRSLGMKLDWIDASHLHAQRS
ncbi:MAG: FkbM family methyltransferase [Caulobacter sp.]|nr:FkbM family methyltransferase [Caulobacter sp.]